MRLVKLLGLAALTATVVMAFDGASSASAEPDENLVLCELAELECENPYPNPTEIHAVDHGVLLETSLLTMECETVIVGVSLLNELDVSITGYVSELMLLGCYTGGLSGECNVNTLSQGGFLFTPLDQLSANVEATKLEGEETVVLVECGSMIHCEFVAGPEALLTAHSDEEGHLTLVADEIELANVGGPICPKETRFTASYDAVNLDESLSLSTDLYLEG